jgi:UDP-N-acetylmuramyl pentapeptide synthase
MDGGTPAEAVHFSSVEDATHFLKQKLGVGDRVLFKASRSMGLDRAVRDLRQWAGDTLRSDSRASMPEADSFS